MLNVNNPAVNLETRAFLHALIDPQRGLDRPTVDALQQAVERAKDISPSGWVFLLARALGASRGDALEAASFAELYYAMCSFTDDVQDGDAPGYMDASDPRLLINTAAQLICVTVVRGERLAARLGHTDGLLSMSQAFLDGAVMLRGQRIELLREDWGTERYAEVAALSAGRQLDVYFRAAALAAGEPPDPLLELSDPLGLLVQVRHDRLSHDPRLLDLPETEVTALVEDAVRRLRETAQALRAAPQAGPGDLGLILDAMVGFACVA